MENRFHLETDYVTRWLRQCQANTGSVERVSGIAPSKSHFTRQHTAALNKAYILYDIESHHLLVPLWLYNEKYVQVPDVESPVVVAQRRISTAQN